MLKFVLFLRRLLAFALIGCVLASSARAEPKKGLGAAKKAFQQGIRSKDSQDRIAALRKLEEFPTPEAVTLILKTGANDDNEDVRRAAAATLASYHEDQEIGKLLLDQLNLMTRKDGMNGATYCILRALGSYEFPDLNLKVPKFVDDYLGTPKGNLLVLTMLIDDLGTQGDEEALRTIALLAKAKFFESNFAYRRCIVQAVTQILKPEAVTFLINLLPRTRGLVQHDVIQHLTNVTRQKLKDDNQRWQQWWAANKATFKFPPPGTLAANEPIDDKKPTYYGIPICAKRIVFALDVSKSMRGAPLEAAKSELIAVVKQLPPEVFFSIVLFDGGVRVWQPSMVAATEEMKQQAVQTVSNEMAAGPVGTASNKALEAAFVLDPEVIYFLSDGAPTDGRPAEIVASISSKNRTRRVSVHTIGINTDVAYTAQLAAFMQALAQADYGTYLAVKDGQRQ